MFFRNNRAFTVYCSGTNNNNNNAFRNNRAFAVHCSGPKYTLWRLNSNILNDPVIKDKLKSEIKLYLENNDSEELTPPILWDALKAVMRGKMIVISSYEKKVREKKLKNLEEVLKRLQKEDAKSLKDNKKCKIIKLKN